MPLRNYRKRSVPGLRRSRTGVHATYVAAVLTGATRLSSGAPGTRGSRRGGSSDGHGSAAHAPHQGHGSPQAPHQGSNRRTGCCLRRDNRRRRRPACSPVPPSPLHA
jgi:hypothetical protein